MKRIFVTLTMVAAFALSASAQKAITNVKCNADEVVQWWNNKKAPHSNEETKDEERDASGHFMYTMLPPPECSAISSRRASLRF